MSMGCRFITSILVSRHLIISVCNGKKDIYTHTDILHNLISLYTESRIPEDDEAISGLNVHVFDSVQKIYLYKKSRNFVMMPARKRGMH